jgi:hypothetical protein
MLLDMISYFMWIVMIFVVMAVFFRSRPVTRPRLAKNPVRVDDQQK